MNKKKTHVPVTVYLRKTKKNKLKAKLKRRGYSMQLFFESKVEEEIS